MVQNARGGARQNQMGRKRKQFGNTVNAKKFKPNSNFRNNGGAGGGPNTNSIRDQRDFARDYMDFESFDDFSDPTPRPFHPPQQRQMSMGPAIPPYPYREPRPLLQLPPAAPMFGARRPLPGPSPGPMHPPHMRRMGHPPMGLPMMGPPMMGRPRPLLPRPPPIFGHGPGRHFGPPGPPMRPMPMGMRPPMHGGPFGRGPPRRGGPGGLPHGRGNKRMPVRAPIVPPHKKYKKVNKKSTPPLEINDMTKPWITDEIREANAKKIELNKIAKDSPTPNPQLWTDFWVMREKVKTMVAAARLEYIGNHPEEDVEKIMSKIDETAGAEANTENITAQIDNDVPLESSHSESADVNPGPSSTNVGNTQLLNEPVLVDCIAEDTVQTPVQLAATVTKATVKAPPMPAAVAPQAKSQATIQSKSAIQTTPTQEKPVVGQVNPAVGVAKPTAAAQAKPTATTCKPAVVTKPAVAVKPVVAAKPAVAAKPVVAAKPAVAAKPVVAAKPAVAKPTVAAKPAVTAATTKPAVAAKPVATAATAKPGTPAVKTVVAASKPAVTPSKPVVAAAKPAAAAAKPAAAAAKPAAAAAKPAATVAKPAVAAQLVNKVVATPASGGATAVTQTQSPSNNSARGRGGHIQSNNRGGRGGNASNYSTRSTRQTPGY